VATISTTAADWGGSSLSGQPLQVGWGGWGGYTSGSPGMTTNSETVTYQPGVSGNPGIDTDGSTVNGLVNFDDNFAAGTGTPYSGLPSNPGSATINGYLGGFDRLVSSELAPSGAGSQNTALLTAINAGHMFAFDFTTPLGGTTLAPAADDAYFIVSVDILASGTGVPAGETNYGVQIAANGGFTQSNPDPGANGDDKGAYVVNNGTYYTAYLPYSYTTLATTTNYTDFKLAIDFNSGGTVDAYGAADGNVTVDNLRIVAPVPEPATTGLTCLSFAALAWRRRTA
jgi:hypothetical protein